MKNMLWWTLISGSLLMVLAMAASRFLGGKIANPIVNMTHAANKIAQGDLNQEINISSRDEVGELAETFRNMQLALKDHIENLDKKVAERTMDLSKAMKVAEEANEAKSEFIANMSHELRTPLNGIIGFAELIMASDSLAKHHDYSELIIAESEALLTLINEILDHAKIEAGKLTLEKIPFDVQLVMQVIISGMALRAREKGLNFELHIAPDVPRYMMGDPNRLRQILVNLIGNALKFTEEGSISVNITLVEKGKHTAKLRLSVADTGVGIPEDKLKTIFDSFSQADTSTTRKYGGTGLGTTISKRLVELMNGDIGVSSRVGKGSTFWFTAVFELSGEEMDEEMLGEMGFDEEDNHKNLTGHILITEDYPTNREIVKNYLAAAGYSFDIAGNGKEALDLTCQKKFDLILMDVQMPVMDGLEATRRIRAGKSSNAAVPILATTANAYEQDEERCLNAGMDEVLTKPLRKKAFLKTVSKWIAHEKSRTEQEENMPVQQAESVNGSTAVAEPLEAADAIPIDIDVFQADTGIDKQVAFQIIDVFLNDTKEQLSSLKKYLENRENEMLEREAHSIKGGAANIRALHLQKAALLLEEAAKKENPMEARALIPEVEAEYRRLAAYIQKMSS